MIVAVVPCGVGHNGLSCDFVEGDGLRRMFGGGGQRHRGADAVGIPHGPFEHLHAAHGTAHNREQRVDAEVIDQTALAADHVADGDHGKFRAVGFSGSRILRNRPGGPHAAADDIGTDHKILVGIDGFARPDHDVPPPRLGVLGMVVARHMRIPGQGMADENGVGLVFVQGAARFIGKGNGFKLAPAVQCKRPVRPSKRERLFLHLPDRSAGGVVIYVFAHGQEG